MKQTQNTGIYKNNQNKNPKQALKSLCDLLTQVI